ncbi:MAG: diaminopimelate epimerase [Nitrospinae bacterium]|nr:diaminopimelate epimerase [Nitrospinota bacterium]
MRFVKMHGIGNDYIYVDGFRESVQEPEKLAVRISDRHFGVGGDGLILIMPSETADARMRIFNADGSEGEMCGNGIRCLAKYVYEAGIARHPELTVETLAGALTLQLFEAGGKVGKVRVNMGMPRLQRQDIPMLGEGERVLGEQFTAGDRHFTGTCLSMGNPHCVVAVDDVANFPVAHYGPLLERHPLFPQRTNVEWIEWINRWEIRQRTWERGSGETLACGTGACAATVASVLNGKTDRLVTVHLLGGDLEIEWAQDHHVYMTGPAVEVFRGEWLE